MGPSAVTNLQKVCRRWAIPYGLRRGCFLSGGGRSARCPAAGEQRRTSHTRLPPRCQSQPSPATGGSAAADSSAPCTGFEVPEIPVHIGKEIQRKLLHSLNNSPWKIDENLALAARSSSETRSQRTAHHSGFSRKFDLLAPWSRSSRAAWSCLPLGVRMLAMKTSNWRMRRTTANRQPMWRSSCGSERHARIVEMLINTPTTSTAPGRHVRLPRDSPRKWTRPRLRGQTNDGRCSPSS